MTVEFDAGTGRLRLDQDSFDTLARWLRGTDEPGPEIAALREAGVIEQGRPHPVLTPGLTAVAEPLCQLAVAVVDQDGRSQTGDGWAAPDGAALLLDLPDGVREFVTVHPMFLPAALARIVQLGPRPRPHTEPAQVSTDRLVQLIDHDARRRQIALDALLAEAPDAANAAAVRALGSGLRQRWTVRAAWTSKAGSPGERRIDVLDTVAGLWVTEIGADGAMVWPTTPTAVWRALTTLLPADAELEE